jgi:hypothetical protein
VTPLPTSVGPDFRALLQRSVRTLCPVFSRLQDRCSPDLPPLRGHPAQPLRLSPLPSGASSRTGPLLSSLRCPFSALQGLDPVLPGKDYVSPPCLHEVFHLIQLAHQPQAPPVSQ